LRAAAWRVAGWKGRAVVAALCSILAASCTSGPDATIDLNMPAYNASAIAPPTGEPSPGEASATIVQPSVLAEGDAELPAQVASLPAANPTAVVDVAPDAAPAENAAVTVAAATTEETSLPDAATETDVATALATDIPASAPLPAARPGSPAVQGATVVSTGSVPDASAAESDPAQVIATSAEWPAQTPPPKKRGLLASFFGASPSAAAPPPVIRDQPAKPLFSNNPRQLIEQDRSKPLVEVSASPRPVVMASLGSDNALPGVRQTALFEIKRKSGLDDDSDVDLHEEEDGGSVRLASAAGLARLAPNGLLKQTEAVDVACLKPSLVRVLKTIEKHYGRSIMVTSGYRSPTHNRRARGAKNSLHMFCAAADVQVPGVAKWELANYVRSMPGRGGVGTYCHTDSVHVDVGPERDWNWRCRRRK